MSDSPMADIPSNSPPNVPDFRLIRPIGEGGFGRVWLAENETTGRLRAIKLIPLWRGGRTDAAGREIASITRLENTTAVDHANLLKIDHVGRTDEHLFYVMDPADNADGTKAANNANYRPATLDHELAQGRFSPEQCLADTRAMLSGLSALHAQGMVHRDVKPANCLFVDGVLKLADFGLLTVADAYTSRVGTEAYMPPDGRMDTRADVYAVGLVIYEMLTGRPAENFPQLGELGNDIAYSPILQRLNHVALRACRRMPEDRYADAQEMLAALDAPLVDDNKQQSDRKRTIKHRLGVVAGIAVSIVFTATFFLVRDRMNTPISQQPTSSPTLAEEKVSVRFTSTPENSLILLDDKVMLAPDGRPHTTPCRAENITARQHHVVFRRFGLPDYDAGVVDFAKEREVRARWE